MPGLSDLRTIVERSPVATLVFGRDQRVRIANEVMAKLIARNADRDKLGAGYSGSRRYVLENERLNKRLTCGVE